MKHDHNWIADAAKALAGGAADRAETTIVSPLQEIQQANERLNTKRGTPAEPLSSGPQLARTPTSARPEEPELAVQHSCDHQLAFDSQPNSSGGHHGSVPQKGIAPTGTEIRVGQNVVEVQPRTPTRTPSASSLSRNGVDGRTSCAPASASTCRPSLSAAASAMATRIRPRSCGQR